MDDGGFNERAARRNRCSAACVYSVACLPRLWCISASALGVALYLLPDPDLPLMTIRVRTPPSGTYSLDPNPILMLILSLFLTLCSGAVWEWRNKWRTAKNDQIAQLSFAVGQEIAARAAGGTSSAEVVQLKADYAKLTMRYEQAIDSAADAQRGNLEAIGNAVKV